MSQQNPEKAIAPKRQRMLDMVLALGGLKEESVIPPGKVKEELENLKNELAPLTDAILAFPDSYFMNFLTVIKKSNLVAQDTTRTCNPRFGKSLLPQSVSAVDYNITLVQMRK